MLTASSRLLRLIALLQSRRYWSGRELSERLEIDPRTLRRDVERLRELGYPVQASAGVGGGYQMGGGAELPPMLLDDDEAVAVAVSLRAAAASVGGIEETAMRLLAKMDQLLPARLRRRASALHAVTISLRSGEPMADADLLTRSAAACRDQQCLRFGYRDRGGRVTQRRVEPMRLANAGRRWYLVAWDLQRGDWRTFRSDRMSGPLQAGPRFTPRTPPMDLAEYVKQAISFSPFEYQLRIRLRGSMQELSKKLPPWAGMLEHEGPASCILSTGADSVEAMAAQLMFAGDFELVERPAWLPQLQEAIAVLGKRVTV
ncbi:helix-turn-helix transcriptional regulator [Solimonas fluminis]|uniref:helix-turn-helix transcriptional regulator n=1 Tax=Solimonas fluminis TaxID=2086571 RepID=UPI00268CF9BA